MSEISGKKVEGKWTTLGSPARSLTLKTQEIIVREGWPSAFRSTTERVWLRLGIEIDRHLQELPSHQSVQKIAYSWSEVERCPTHAVWEATALIDRADSVR